MNRGKGSPALTVVLAGGGTAGHVNPMLAVGRELLERDPATRVVAVGTDTGLESRLVPAAGLELRTIPRVPLPRRPSLDLLRLPSRMAAAVARGRAILRETGADAVLGVGGYVCTPMYVAARSLGVPIVVHEANMRPGLANKVGAALTTFVGTAYEGIRLPHARAVGMPMRKEVSGLDRAAARPDARRRLGLDPSLPTVAVTGGSSGAKTMNEAVAAVVPVLEEAGVQVLHIVGRGKAIPVPDSPNYRQLEYVDRMEDVYAAADLLVCRSGSGTVSEVCAVGVPAVFVPLPVGNGEQRLNAARTVKAGGALLVDNADFTPAYFTGTVIPLTLDPRRLEAMSRASRALGVTDADAAVADMVEAAARTRNQGQEKA